MTQDGVRPTQRAKADETGIFEEKQIYVIFLFSINFDLDK